MKEGSAVDIEEKELVRWAFTKMPGKLLLPAALEIKSPLYSLGLELGSEILDDEERVTAELDALIWPHIDPACACAARPQGPVLTSRIANLESDGSKAGV